MKRDIREIENIGRYGPEKTTMSPYFGDYTVVSRLQRGSYFSWVLGMCLIKIKAIGREVPTH